MTTQATVHHPVVDYWPRTATTPAEVFAQCVCGRFEYSSQESVGGGVEPWGPAFDEHLEEVEQ